MGFKTSFCEKLHTGCKFWHDGTLRDGLFCPARALNATIQAGVRPNWVHSSSARRGTTGGTKALYGGCVECRLE